MYGSRTFTAGGSTAQDIKPVGNVLWFAVPDWPDYCRRAPVSPGDVRAGYVGPAFASPKPSPGITQSQETIVRQPGGEHIP